MRKKYILFYVILVVFTFLICDGMVGIYLLCRHPMLQPGLGLPGKLSQIAHPYRSYMLVPGVHWWEKGYDVSTVKMGDKKYRFDLFKGGTVIDEFGHQIFPKDAPLLAKDKTADQYRILFIGGSTTFQPWPHLIEQYLNNSKHDPAKRIISINSGEGGYTSQENLIDLAIDGFEYQPDLVVAYLPINDISQALLYPNFKRDYTHVRIPYSVTTQMPKPELHSPRWPFTLYLVNVLNYEKKLVAYYNAVDLVEHTCKKPTPPSYDLKDRQEDYKLFVAALIDNIVDMDALCRAHGVKFLLITQKTFVSQEPLFKETDPIVHMVDAEIINSPRLSHVRILDAQGIYPDQWTDRLKEKARQYFPDAAIDFKREFHYDMIHFSASGCYLFAILIGDYIQKNFLSRQ